MSDRKTYLGDGAYADVEHGDLVLTTENGIRTTNRIVLGGAEWEALVRYVERLRAESFVPDALRAN